MNSELSLRQTDLDLTNIFAPDRFVIISSKNKLVPEWKYEQNYKVTFTQAKTSKTRRALQRSLSKKPIADEAHGLTEWYQVFTWKIYIFLNSGCILVYLL